MVHTRSMVGAMLVLICGGLLGGCAGARLLDERRTEPYASLLARGAALGQRSAFVNGAADEAPPLHLHLVSTPTPLRGRGPLLVLQSGLMADHETWRFLVPLLAERYDCLLVDPPGLGLSEKPRVEVLGETAYSPAWLGRHTLRAVARWEQRQPGGVRRRLVLVGHSLGSLAFLMALGDPDLPPDLRHVAARVEKLVLFQCPDVGLRDVHPTFKRLAETGDAAFFLAAGSGLLRLGVEHSIPDTVVDPCHRALRLEAQRIDACLSCAATRRAAQAMVRRFRPCDACGTPDPVATARLEARYGRVRQPTLLLYGAQDDYVPPAVGRKLAVALPHARLHLVPDAKHSAHLEVPARCARIVRAFLEGDGAAPWGVRPRSLRAN